MISLNRNLFLKRSLPATFTSEVLVSAKKKAVYFTPDLTKDRMTKTDLFYLAAQSIALNTSVPN